MVRTFGTTPSAVLLIIGVALVATTVTGCGYSEDEWQAQLAKYGQLSDKHQALQADRDQLQKKLDKVSSDLEAEKKRVAGLEADLTAAGLDINKLNESLSKSGKSLAELNAVLEERERALAEYKARAAQLEKIKARFEKLRAKLNALTNLGLKVVIRNNRMVIQLPGDVLFESGQDRLKKGGKDVVKKVANIIGGDPGLKSRVYQVAGHTDNVELKGGLFGDNWGLSVMRARQVLLYLIDPKTGGLPRDKWSAAGFADTDPVATNETPDGRQANRRCEVIVVPSAEEMLDLKNIAN